VPRMGEELTRITAGERIYRGAEVFEQLPKGGKQGPKICFKKAGRKGPRHPGVPVSGGHLGQGGELAGSLSQQEKAKGRGGKTTYTISA